MTNRTEYQKHLFAQAADDELRAMDMLAGCLLAGVFVLGFLLRWALS